MNIENTAEQILKLNETIIKQQDQIFRLTLVVQRNQDIMIKIAATAKYPVKDLLKELNAK